MGCVARPSQACSGLRRLRSARAAHGAGAWLPCSLHAPGRCPRHLDPTPDSRGPALLRRDTATKAHDAQAFKYLSWALYPLVACYAVYALVYESHKSWYSWVINSLVGAVYTFGFLSMTPQVLTAEHGTACTAWHRVVTSLVGAAHTPGILSMTPQVLAAEHGTACTARTAWHWVIGLCEAGLHVLPLRQACDRLSWCIRWPAECASPS